MPFSLGLLWNRNSVMRRSCRPDLSNGQNGQTFDPIVGSRSNFCTSFWRPFSFGLLGNRYSLTRRSSPLDVGNWSKWPQLSIQPLDRPQIFGLVFRGHFPWGFYVIATRRRGDLVRQTCITGQNSHNFRSDHWIALKCLHEFLEAIFLGVATESQLDDEEVWSARLD
jgi:hypothetical protein